MKRSQMVSKIAAVIYNFNEPYSYVDRKKCLEIAKVILQVQEENGMLPPGRFEDFGNYSMDMYGEILPSEGWVNEWEPEDE